MSKPTPRSDRAAMSSLTVAGDSTEGAVNGRGSVSRETGTAECPCLGGRFVTASDRALKLKG